MPAQHYRTTLNILTTVFVTVAVLGAFALSGAAVMENARFVKATNQILEPIGLVRGS